MYLVRDGTSPLSLPQPTLAETAAQMCRGGCPLTGGLWPPPHFPCPLLLFFLLFASCSSSFLSFFLLWQRCVMPTCPCSPSCSSPVWVITHCPELTAQVSLATSVLQHWGSCRVPATSHHPAGRRAQEWNETEADTRVERSPSPSPCRWDPVPASPCGAGPCRQHWGQYWRTGAWSVAEVQGKKSKQMELGLSEGMGKPRREVQYAEKAGASGDELGLSGANIPSGMANHLPSADTGHLKM